MGFSISKFFRKSTGKPLTLQSLGEVIVQCNDTQEALKALTNYTQIKELLEEEVKVKLLRELQLDRVQERLLTAAPDFLEPTIRKEISGLKDRLTSWQL